MKLKHRLGVWFIGVGAWLIEDMRKEIPNQNAPVPARDFIAVSPYASAVKTPNLRIVSKSGKPI